MATNDPNWTDEDFDDPSSGFLSSSSKPFNSEPAPVPEPEPQSPPRVQPPPVVPSITPPPPIGRQSNDHSSVRRTVLLLLLFFICAVGLGIFFLINPMGGGDNGSVVETEPLPKADTVAPIPPTDSQIVTTQAPSDLTSQSPDAESQALSATENTNPARTITRRIAVPHNEVATSSKPDLDSPSPETVPAPSKQPPTRNSMSTDQEWCIQVYASTNADDADEWEARLKSKNIVDSRIEVVDRQGQTWYRVRFGKFKTREDAEQLAMNLGFSNAWINRIR